MMDEKYQKQLENIVDWTKELIAENALLWAVVEPVTAQRDRNQWLHMDILDALDLVQSEPSLDRKEKL